MRERIAMRVGLWATVAMVVLAGCATPVKSPVVDRSSGASTAPTVGGGSVGAASLPEFHQVAPGETLFAIARRYGVAPETLVQLNGLSDPDRIFVGQQLRLRPGATPSGGATGVQVFPVGTPSTTATGPDAQGGAGMPGGSTASSTGVATGGRLSAPPLTATAPVGTPESGTATATGQPATTPPANASGWTWPARGPVLAPFDGKIRKGIDIGGNVGDPVYAAMDGTVSYVGEGIEGFGLIVILQHANDYVSVYAHNDKVVVKEGDTVKRGQIIARMGKSGNADRPKLHFQIRRAGKAIDPETVLPKT
ncbi:M23 family metallopeptidase [Hydrogenophilus thermoluteolus]|uniref:Peptidase n=1 Tax=Hydrogenophilus thermoluteolus TaxID=297 RepID=A0A2Z6E0M5_HYDTE|nr:M23 family metallopeptidase [Hydrogenophilus thermoluteolus]BBD78075.1 peptidase [Hydrogenophilus thermoluteolus]